MLCDSILSWVAYSCAFFYALHCIMYPFSKSTGYLPLESRFRGLQRGSKVLHSTFLFVFSSYFVLSREMTMSYQDPGNKIDRSCVEKLRYVYSPQRNDKATMTLIQPSIHLHTTKALIPHHRKAMKWLRWRSVIQPFQKTIMIPITQMYKSSGVEVALTAT
jgi:hypothetical protein